jgi:hypothetical protein
MSVIERRIVEANKEKDVTLLQKNWNTSYGRQIHFDFGTTFPFGTKSQKK